MTPEQYRQLRDAFDRLAQLHGAARQQALDAEFPPGHALREELESLLQTVTSATRTHASTVAATTAAAADASTMAAPARPMPGDTIGARYKLVRLLGAGGFSQAFLAEDSLLHGKQVVIKIPLPDPTHTGEWFTRHFADEIRALAALNHPNIVEVLDSGKDDLHGEFFTEQFIEGPALSQLLKENQGRLSMDRCVRMLERIANALAAAHSKGVIHRDLKPHNIQVRMAGTRQESPVLIDFGIASLLGPEGSTTVTTRVAGTPDYLAPEQAVGKVLPQSDLYAYGCIVVEMLTGEKLHARLVRSSADTTPEKMALAMLTEKVGGAPAEVLQTLARLLSVNPAERGLAQDYAALFHAWPRQEPSIPPASALQPRAPSSSPFNTVAPQVTPAPTQPQRRSVLVMGGAGAAVVALGGAAYVFSGGGGGAGAGGAKQQQSSATAAGAGTPRLRLTVKAVRSNNASGISAISPRDGVVTRNDRLRLQVTASPQAFCYVFGASMASSIEPPGELMLLFPPRPLTQPLATLTVPSTANDWIEFDNKPEILRFLFIASREQPLAEADAAVTHGAANKGVVADAAIRAALESRVTREHTVNWQQGEADAWYAESTSGLLILEGRLQHLAV